MGPDAGGPSSVGMGVSKAIKDALTELHVSDKIVENTDQLLVSFQLVNNYVPFIYFLSEFIKEYFYPHIRNITNCILLIICLFHFRFQL